MSVALLLVSDSHVREEEVRTLTKRSAIFEMVPHTGMHLPLSETKTRAHQSVDDRFKTVKPLSLRHYLSSKNEEEGLFLFSANHIGTRIHEMMRGRSPLTDERFVITLHHFLHGGAIRAFMLKRRLKN